MDSDARRRGVALTMVAAVYAILLAASWQTWPNLTIDGGREMNTPVGLLAGERIYEVEIAAER